MSGKGRTFRHTDADFEKTPLFEKTKAQGNRYFDYYQEQNLLPPAFAARMKEETEKLKNTFAGSAGRL